MTDLRRRLKDEFVPAGWSPDESLVDVRLAARHGRRRRATRAACGAAGVALVVAVVLIGATVGLGSTGTMQKHPAPPASGASAWPTPAGGVLPFVGASTAPDAAATQVPTTQPAPACRTEQIQTAAGRSGVGLGHSGQTIHLRNVSTVPCRLIGTVRVSRSPADGGGVLASESITPLANGPVTVGTGMQADLIEGTLNCPKPPGRLLHAVTLQIGEASWTVAGMSVSLSCGPLMLEELVPPTQPATTPIGIASLTATGVIPGIARPGQQLVYTVTLSNHTSSPVRFTRCPTFTEGLVTDLPHTARKYQWTYRLNCGSVHSLAPRTSASFQMILDVPARTPSGTAKMFWSLDAWPMQVGVGKIIRVQG